MRKGLWLGVLCFVPVISNAVVIPSPPDSARPVINKVNYQTSAEGWVVSQTAEVTINISASLTEQQLAKAHSEMLDKLNSLVKADWHITQFNRNPNQSGLEQLQVEASARLPEEALVNIRSQAKKISKEGETFSVGNIDFTPTLADSIAEREVLRQQIYTQIQRELATLNKMYPNQRYIVHDINFSETSAPQPQIRAMVAAAGAGSQEGENAPLTVQNKLTLNAYVSLASVNQ